MSKAIREVATIDSTISDRELIEKNVVRIVVQANDLEITLAGNDAELEDNRQAHLRIRFTPNLSPKKGVICTPTEKNSIDSASRDNLLQAIARARRWMDAITTGKASSIEEIADQENLGERHIRRLAILAFLSPKIISSIADGSASSDLTVSRLTQALPIDWAEQETMISRG